MPSLILFFFKFFYFLIQYNLLLLYVLQADAVGKRKMTEFTNKREKLRIVRFYSTPVQKFYKNMWVYGDIKN